MIRSVAIRPLCGAARPALSISLRLGLLTARNISNGRPTITPPVQPTVPHLIRLVDQTEAMFTSQIDIPSEQRTLHALNSLHTVAKSLASRPSLSPGTSAPSLLDVNPTEDSSLQVFAPGQTKKQVRRAAVERVSEAAFRIVADEKVVVTEKIARVYVDVHSALGIANTIAEVLAMHVSKPVPRLSSTGEITYKTPFSIRPRIIPPDLANSALQVALDTRDISAAINIVDVSFCSRPYYIHKALSCAIPVSLFGTVIPTTAYGIATQFAAANTLLNASFATGLAFSGIMAYVLFTGSLGLVAKLGNMDHMVRVTWIPGTPYRIRWFREAEREALDKIAMTWGFREAWKHGEETGEDWEALREWMGLRGMILDRVEFMENLN